MGGYLRARGPFGESPLGFRSVVGVAALVVSAAAVETFGDTPVIARYLAGEQTRRRAWASTLLGLR